MKFTEFLNKNKNVVATGVSQRISAAIPISEERDAFFTGELFKKYDLVESEGTSYRVLEQRSNYYAVVDESGNVARKFANQLAHVGPSELFITESNFHGYKIQTEAACEWFTQNFSLNEDNDDVGILKTLKEMDSKVDDYKPKDKLTVAKMIADIVGVPHDAISDPNNLVNAAIRKAKKDPVLMKNKAILQNMIQIAKEVGIRISDTSFEVKEDVNEAFPYAAVSVALSKNSKSSNPTKPYLTSKPYDVSPEFAAKMKARKDSVGKNKEKIKESEHTATYVKTPVSQSGSKTTIHKSEHEFLSKAKELHGELTVKKKSIYNKDDTHVYHNKDGHIVGSGGGDYDNKNWSWRLHSKPIKESLDIAENETFNKKSPQYKTTMKHAKNPTVTQRMAAHDIKPGVAGYKDRIDLLKDLARTGKLKEAVDEIDEHIVKTASGYRLVSKSTGKNLGDFDSMEAAKKHEQEVEYFKHANESVINEEPKPTVTTSSSGKKLVSAFDVLAHAKKIATAEHGDKKGKVLVSREHIAKARSHLLGEEVIDELNKNTLASYSGKARADAVKKVNQGAKAKTLETGYSKMKKAATRLAGAAKADKKVFNKDFKERTGQNESVDAPTYSELKHKLDSEQEKTGHLPAEHLKMATNHTTRKMIIKKLKGD